MFFLTLLHLFLPLLCYTIYMFMLLSFCSMNVWQERESVPAGPQYQWEKPLSAEHEKCISLKASFFKLSLLNEGDGKSAADVMFAQEEKLCLF